MAVSVACKAIYWPTPGFKGRTFRVCVLTRWDFNFCVRSSPLRGTMRKPCTVRQVIMESVCNVSSFWWLLNMVSATRKPYTVRQRLAGAIILLREFSILQQQQKQCLHVSGNQSPTINAKKYISIYRNQLNSKNWNEQSRMHIPVSQILDTASDMIKP